MSMSELFEEEARNQKLIEIASDLKNQLKECLEIHNAEQCINRFKYDADKQQVMVVLDVHVVEEDDYIGFGSY